MKFRIKDEDGNQYIVEEDKRDDIVEDEDIVEESVEAIEEVKDEDGVPSLTAEEITALKQLASIAPKLMSMVTEVTDEDIDEEDKEDEIVEDDIDEDLDEEDKEQVVDTDEDIEEEEEEKKITTDSKKSFGSIEKRKTSVVDNSLRDDVSAAWQKRLNGGLK